MKRAFLFSVFCVALMGFVGAQNYTHTWKMGKLSWNDFSHNTSVDGHHSYMEYYVQIKSDEYHKVDNITYAKPKVVAYMVPFYSWADTSYRTPELLRYNQCCFDLLEVYRRRLENDLQKSTIFDSDQLLGNTMRRLDEDIRRVFQETSEGADTAALGRWEKKIADLLDSVKNDNEYGYVDAPFRWGFSLGLGYQAVCGELDDIFRNGMGMSMNFEMGVKRFWWNSSMYIGGSRCLVDNLYNVHHDYDDLFIDDELAVMDLYTSLGYSVIDNNKMRLTPFVGYGRMIYCYTPDEGSSVGSGDGCWHFGIDYNRYFHNQVTNWGLINDYYNGDHSTMNLNVRLYATYNNFQNATLDYQGLMNNDPNLAHPKGFTINLQVGVGLTGGRAHCK